MTSVRGEGLRLVRRPRNECKHIKQQHDGNFKNGFFSRRTNCGAQAIGSKRTSVGGKKTRRPGSDCVRGRLEEALALETLALIVEGGREGARMIISINTWFRVCWEICAPE